MPPRPLRGTPSSRTRTPVLEAPRRVSCSLWPSPPLCCSWTPGASPTSVPSVETSARREATSTTVVRAVGSRTRGDSGGGGAAGTGTSTGGSSTAAGDCPQAIDATLSAGPRQARAKRQPPIVRLPLSSPKRERPAAATGAPAPHPRAGLLAHGSATQATPRWRLHVRVRPPTFPRSDRPQWRPMEDVEPARFLGPLRSQWRDRAGLSPASLLGPTWAPGGKPLCGTAAARRASGSQGVTV